MTQLSFDLEDLLSGHGKESTQGDFSQQLLHFLHHSAIWQEWLDSCGLQELWSENKEGLLEAVTHPSLYHQVDLWPVKHNQRLEFLGDAALDFYVTKKLFHLYPDRSEGDLSKLRATIVNEEGLALWARLLHMDSILLVGKGELKRAAVNDSMLSDALEAIVGMMSIGLSGWEDVLDLWVRLYDEKSDPLFFSIERLASFDPRTTLQEKTLALYKQLPHYETKELEEGLFEATLSLGEHQLEKACEASKKKAKALAAKQCLGNKSYLGLNVYRK